MILSSNVELKKKNKDAKREYLHIHYKNIRIKLGNVFNTMKHNYH